MALDNTAGGDDAPVTDVGAFKNDGSSPDPAIGSNCDVTASVFPINRNPTPEDMVMIINEYIGPELAAITNSY